MKYESDEEPQSIMVFSVVWCFAVLVVTFVLLGGLLLTHCQNPADVNDITMSTDDLEKENETLRGM